MNPITIIYIIISLGQLTKLNYNATINGFAALLNVPKELIQAQLQDSNSFLNDAIQRYKLGFISFIEFKRDLCQALGVNSDIIDDRAFLYTWCHMVGVQQFDILAIKHYFETNSSYRLKIISSTNFAQILFILLQLGLINDSEFEHLAINGTETEQMIYIEMLRQNLGADQIVASFQSHTTSIPELASQLIHENSSNIVSLHKDIHANYREQHPYVTIEIIDKTVINFQQSRV